MSTAKASIYAALTNDNKTLQLQWKHESAPHEGVQTVEIELSNLGAQLKDFLVNALEGGQETVVTIDKTIQAADKDHNLTPARDRQQPSVTASSNEVTVRYPKGTIPTVVHGKANFITGIEYTEEWQATWLRAVALAWSDPDLKAALLRDPYRFFHNHCNYELPPTVDVVVLDTSASRPQDTSTVQVNEVGFAPAGSGEKSHEWKWHLPRSVVLMFLPPKPAASQDAVALVAYEAVGAQYPFTVTS